MEKDRLLFSISRYDSYFDSINNKGNVVLGLSTFITGALIAGYSTLNELCNFTIWGQINLIAIILLGIGATFTLLLASIPYLTPKSKSLFYFQAVSLLTEKEFEEQSKGMNEENELDDLRKQARLLAKGLVGKFEKLRLATILNLFQIGLLIPFILFIICHLK